MTQGQADRTPKEYQDAFWRAHPTVAPWREPDPNPISRLALFPILGWVRARTARLTRTQPSPLPSAAPASHRRERSSPGAADSSTTPGAPPRSAPGRRTPRYHSLRDLT